MTQAMFDKTSGPDLDVVKQTDKLFGPLTNILTLSQTTNFRLFQTERACRQQF